MGEATVSTPCFAPSDFPVAQAAAHSRSNLFLGTPSARRNPWLDLLLGLLLASICVANAAAAQTQLASVPGASSNKAQSHDSGLPLNFKRHTGDLDAMIKRGSIRALVLYSRSGFFYVNGRPEGIYYEALQYFEQFVNRKLPVGQ